MMKSYLAQYKRKHKFIILPRKTTTVTSIILIIITRIHIPNLSHIIRTKT